MLQSVMSYLKTGSKTSESYQDRSRDVERVPESKKQHNICKLFNSRYFKYFSYNKGYSGYKIFNYLNFLLIYFTHIFDFLKNIPIETPQT